MKIRKNKKAFYILTSFILVATLTTGLLTAKASGLFEGIIDSDELIENLLSDDVYDNEFEDDSYFTTEPNDKPLDTEGDTTGNDKDSSTSKDSLKVTTDKGVLPLNPIKDNKKGTLGEQGANSGFIAYYGEDIFEADYSMSAEEITFVLDSLVGVHKDFTIKATNKTTNQTKELLVTESFIGEEGTTYNFTIKGFKYKTGDNIVVEVNLPDTVSSITAFLIGNEFKLTNKTKMYFTAKTVYIPDGKPKTNITTKDLTLTGYGTASISGNVLASKGYQEYILKNEQGAYVTNTDVIIALVSNNTKYKLKTNAKGSILIPTESIQEEHTIDVEGYYTETRYGTLASKDDTSFFLSEEIVLQVSDKAIHDKGKADLDKNIKDTNDIYKVNITTDYDTRLSTAWLQVVIKTNKNVEMFVDSETKEIYLPKGDTLKSVTAEYADVVSYSLKGGKLNVKLKPKYTFEVYSGGDSYDITIENSSPPLVLKGRKKLVFGIMPNDSYFLVDNKTKEATPVTATTDKSTVAFDPKYGVTKGGSASNPHTNTWVTLITIILISAFILCVAIVTIYKKKKLKKAANMFTLVILVGSGILGYVAMGYSSDKAYANGGSIGGTIGDGGDTTGIQNDHYIDNISHIGLAEVYFADTTALGRPESIKSKKATNLTNVQKFSKSYREKAVYFALDDDSYEVATRKSSGVVFYDKKVGACDGMRAIRGKNAFSGIVQKVANATDTSTCMSVGNAVGEMEADAIVHPALTLKGYKGHDNEFVEAITAGLRSHHRTSTSEVYSISAAKNGKALPKQYSYGSEIGKYIEKTYMKDNAPKSEKRDAIFSGYISKVKFAWTGTKSEYEKWATNMTNKYENGELILIINTLIGVKYSKENIGNNSTPFAFISIHDYLAWYKDVRKKLGRTSSIDYTKEHKGIDRLRDKEMSKSNKWGNPVATASAWIAYFYIHTLQPENDVYPAHTSSNRQPYGGWGYVWFNVEGRKKSVITGTIIYYETDENNNRLEAIETETIKMYGTGFPFLDVRLEEKNQRIPVDTVKIVEENNTNVIYAWDEKTPLDVTIRDVPRKENSCKSLKAGYMTDKTDWTLNGKQGLDKAKVSAETFKNDINKVDISKKLDLRAANIYIGNANQVVGNSFANTPVVSKYKKEGQKENETCIGDVTVTIRIDLKKQEVEVEGSKYEVQQWELSSFFEDVPFTVEGNYGIGSVSVPYAIPASSVPTINRPSNFEGSQTTNMTGTTVTVKAKHATDYKWVQSESDMVRDEAEHLIITRPLNDWAVSGTTPADLGPHLYHFTVGHDLTPYRTSTPKLSGADKIDSYNIAEWVPNTEVVQYKSAVVVEKSYLPQEKVVTTKTVTKPYQNVISIEDTVDGKYTVTQKLKGILRKTCYVSGGLDSPGYSYDCSTPYNASSSTNITATIGKPTIDTSILYKKYTAPQNTKDNIKEDSVDIISPFGSVRADRTKLSLPFYPEVAMKIQQPAPKHFPKFYGGVGHYSVTPTFAVGEKVRNLKPFSSSISYLKKTAATASLKTTVTGAEATTMPANNLSNQMSLSNNGVKKSVMPKGTNTANSMELKDAKVVVKHYYIDYAKPIFQSTWNKGGSVASANAKQQIEKYLKDNKINAEAESFYLVEGERMEKTKSNVVLKVDPSKIKETKYDMTIRGGVLQKVGGRKAEDLIPYFNNEKLCEYDKLEDEDTLKDLSCALRTMYIENAETPLFGVLHNKTGSDKIIDDSNKTRTNVDFVSMINKMRGTEHTRYNNVRHKLGNRWYIEDTTAFTIVEVRMEAEVPSITWNAKIPLDYKGATAEKVKTPVDSSQYFTKGVVGSLGTKITLNKELDLSFTLTTPTGYGKTQNYVSGSGYDYVIPNVSVVDGFH